MYVLFGLIGIFLAYLFGGFLLEGFGYLVRRLYYFLTGGSMSAADLAYSKKKKLASFDWSQNYQAAIVAIIVIVVTIGVVQVALIS